MKKSIKRRSKDSYDNRRTAGFLRIIEIDESTGEISRILAEKNIITYTATNIIARTLSGDVNYKISNFLLGGKDGAAPDPAGVAAREDSVMDVLTSYAGDNPIVVDVPAVSPQFTGIASPTNASPAQQTDNLVTFTGIMPSEGSFNGKWFHEAGCIARVGAIDYMFAHVFYTPVEKKLGFNLIYTWSFRFL